MQEESFLREGVAAPKSESTTSRIVAVLGGVGLLFFFSENQNCFYVPLKVCKLNYKFQNDLIV